MWIFSNRLTSSGHLGTASMDWVMVSSCMAPSFCPSCCWHHHFQSSEYSANNLENLLFFTWPWMTSDHIQLVGWNLLKHHKSHGLHQVRRSNIVFKSPNPSNEWKHLSLSQVDPSRQFNVRKRIQTIKIISTVYQLGRALHVPRVRFLVLSSCGLLEPSNIKWSSWYCVHGLSSGFILHGPFLLPQLLLTSPFPVLRIQC